MYAGLIRSLQDRRAAREVGKCCLAKPVFIFIAGALDLVVPEGER